MGASVNDQGCQALPTIPVEPCNQDGLIEGIISIAEGGRLKDTTVFITYRGVQDLPEQKVRLEVPVDSNGKFSVSCKDVPESEQAPCRAATWFTIVGPGKQGTAWEKYDCSFWNTLIPPKEVIIRPSDELPPWWD